MKPRFASKTVWSLVAALASAGCGDLGGPATSPPIEAKLDFCANDIPIWFAHQSNNAPWTVIDPDTKGTFTFSVGTRGGVAFVRQFGNDFKTEVIFTTKTNYQMVSGVECLEEGGPKAVSGTVAGVGGTQLAIVGMSSSSVSLPAQETSFTLTQLVDRPLDVVASRVDVVGTEQQANKIIIRRDQNPASGTTMAPLDFDAAGVTPVSAFANFSGLLQDDTPALRLDFITALGTSHMLTSVATSAATSAVPFAAVPAQELVIGDFHRLLATVTEQDGGVRGVERFFTEAAGQALPFGPGLQLPEFSRVDSTAPYLRLVTALPGQIDYSTSVRTHFHQVNPGYDLDFVMTFTASYFGGTPFTWNLLIPDLSDADAWDSTWGLKVGDIDWTVSAFFGRPALLFGAKPEPGEAVVFASRTSTVTIAEMQLNRVTPTRQTVGIKR